MVFKQYEKKVKTSKGYKTVNAWLYDTRYKDVHIKQSGFCSEPKAKAALRKKMNELDELYPDEKTLALREKRERMDALKFSYILPEYFEYKKLQVKNISDITAFFVTRITPFFGEMIIYNIDDHTIEEWQKWLLSLKYYVKKVYKKEKGLKVLDEELSEKKVYSNSSIKNSHTYLKEFFDYCHKNKYIKDNPMRFVKRVRNKNELPNEIKYWNVSEFEKFIKTVDDDIYNMFFNLLFWTGMRLGEALALNWNDINFKKMTIVINKSYDSKKRAVTTTKSIRSNRTVLINKSLVSALKNVYSTQKQYDGFKRSLFIFGMYQPLDDNTLRRYKNKHCDLSNVQQIKIHELRHSHVSLLINNRFTPFEIARRIGDTEAMVLKTYAHMFAITQKNMTDFLETEYQNKEKKSLT